jgi:uncharacterized membrane protein
MFSDYQDLFIIYSIGIISVFLLSCLTYFISNKFSVKFSTTSTYYIFYFSLIFYIISILYLSFGKIQALHHYADFATHLEILWRNSQGLGLTTLMSEKYHGGSHWFAAHFTPIIYLTYVPTFMIWPSPYSISVSETLFITSSLIPLWMISKKHLNNNLSRLFICSFLFYPTIFYTNLYGISYLELCVPLFLWLFYFFEEKKNILFLIFLVLCLMIREEVSLVTCFFGIYMIIKKRYLLGLLTIILSLVYFYMITFLIMPLFRAEDFEKVHITARWYSEWGDTFWEMITNILFNPIDTLSKILTPPKIGNFVMILIPLIFIPLVNLPIFLIATPNLAIAFLSSAITHSSYFLYYLSPSISIFFYSTILSVGRSNKWNLFNQNSLINSILVASITTTIFFGATPISIAFWNKDYKVGNFYTTNFHRSAYVEEERDVIAKKIVKLIPENAVVSAEQHFLPLLYKKKKMKVFPDEDISVEYVLIDRLNPKKTGGMDDNYLSFRLDPDFYYQKYLKNTNWSIVAEDKGVTLLKKNNL